MYRFAIPHMSSSGHIVGPGTNPTESGVAPGDKATSDSEAKRHRSRKAMENKRIKIIEKHHHTHHQHFSRLKCKKLETGKKNMECIVKGYPYSAGSLKCSGSRETLDRKCLTKHSRH